MNKNPIGIFDSGVGGLTVCKAIREAMPSEDIIYFGDTRRFPYGTRSIETVIRYSREITEYLISRNVKMIVIACNTSSAAALDILKNENSIPIAGVVDAGARAACRRAKGRKIGVIATRATVKSGSYVKAVRSIDPRLETVQKHASVLVTLTEEGWTDNEVARLTAKEYIQEMYDSGVRTLILGCTHFPLLKKAINEVFPDLDLVDTGEEIALEVRDILREKNLENNNKAGQITLYASDITDTLERLVAVFFGTGNTRIKRLVIEGKQD